MPERLPRVLHPRLALHACGTLIDKELSQSSRVSVTCSGSLRNRVLARHWTPWKRASWGGCSSRVPKVISGRREAASEGGYTQIYAAASIHSPGFCRLSDSRTLVSKTQLFVRGQGLVSPHRDVKRGRCSVFYQTSRS